MIIARIEGATRVCGKEQGYTGLPIRDEIVEIEGVGAVNFMVSAWEPTPEDITRILAGGKVHVWIAGKTPPVMRVNVGQVEGEAS